MLVQRAHTFLTCTNRDSFFTGVTSGANRFVSAAEILVTELGHVEMRFGRRTGSVGGGRVLLDSAQRSGMDRRRKTFLAAAAGRGRSALGPRVMDSVLEQIARPCAPHHDFTR